MEDEGREGDGVGAVVGTSGCERVEDEGREGAGVGAVVDSSGYIWERRTIAPLKFLATLPFDSLNVEPEGRGASPGCSSARRMLRASVRVRGLLRLSFL